MKINPAYIRTAPCEWDEYLIAVYANSSAEPIAYVPGQAKAATVMEALHALADKRKESVKATEVDRTSEIG